MLIANYKKIENYEEVDPSLAKAMIFSTLAVGFGEITEKNKKRYFNRLNLLQKVNGPWFDRFVTQQDVDRFVGLKTNVTNETKSQFLSRTFKYVEL